jgi:hypothetical protein
VHVQHRAVSGRADGIAQELAEQGLVVVEGAGHRFI